MIAIHPIYGYNYSYHIRGDRSPLIYRFHTVIVYSITVHGIPHVLDWLETQPHGLASELDA